MTTFNAFTATTSELIKELQTVNTENWELARSSLLAKAAFYLEALDSDLLLGAFYIKELDYTQADVVGAVNEGYESFKFMTVDQGFTLAELRTVTAG